MKVFLVTVMALAFVGTLETAMATQEHNSPHKLLTEQMGKKPDIRKDDSSCRCPYFVGTVWVCPENC